jgi:alkylation response protein AidB-like acyl-CoA dehydrogenase
MDIEEALACADGSVGWVVTLCAGASWFGGFMNPEFAKELFGTEKVCIAGSGAASGTAEMKSGGYVVTGTWPYASGTPEATAFTANCVVTQNGTPVKGDNGADKVISVVLLKSEVTVNDDWNGVGMAGTGSHSFSAAKVTVKADRTFVANEDPQVGAALYAYPFQQFAEATLAINLSGMAFHFMDLCKQMIEDKSSAYPADHQLHETFAALMQKLQTARQKLYYAVDMSWQVCTANKNVSQSVLYKVSAASSSCSSIVRDCVNTLFPYCGLAAANKASEINRVWRDIQTASQHSLLVGDGSL